MASKIPDVVAGNTSVYEVAMNGKSRLASAGAILFALSACGAQSAAHSVSPSPVAATTPAAQVHAQSITVNGVQRSYELFVPSTLDPSAAAPLVLILHPCPDATAAQVAVLSHLDDLATADRFVAVYPQGAPVPNQQGTCWNAGRCCTGADDVGFISQLIDHLTAQQHIDKARVFITGFSFGAAMTYRLGCELADKVTAIAPISGALVFSGCHPSRPVSLLIMQGTADSNFPYSGGGDYTIPSVASVATQWADYDGCGRVGSKSQSGIVTTTEWQSCRGGAVVRLEVISGAPHAWFGLEPNPLPGEPNASSTVWNFFNSLSISA